MYDAGANMVERLTFDYGLLQELIVQEVPGIDLVDRDRP
jgi:hypothetical protein